MRFVTREEQDVATEEHGLWRRPPGRALNDGFFDGTPLPREIVPRHWRPEGDVHEGRRIARSVDSTRYFTGPQVLILRDDMRRLTWVATVEQQRLVLHEYRPSITAEQRERRVLAEGAIRRHHIALDKFTGRITPMWVTAPTRDRAGELWFDGDRVETQAGDVDFPFFAYSQVPIGLVQPGPPPFGIMGYKSRDTGRVFVRRVEGADVGPEQVVVDAETVGGVSFGIVGDDVVARVDLLRAGQLVPALLTSTDGGRSFGRPEPIDLSPALDQGFSPRPGYQAPVVDKGGAFHVPIAMANDSEAVALNHVLASDMLVEAIRVQGGLAKTDGLVFPSTVGSGNTFGNGVSDGHGLIWVLSTDDGRLFSSNSSAGGSHFPEARLLNHEMPLIAEFAASECYSGGLVPNVVSMDYVFVEADATGRPISGEVFIETWDMPLPLPTARARAVGGAVEVEILNDADLEPGKVTFGFDDPAVNVTGVEITDLRHATVHTDGEGLRGRTISFDVLTLFHRHHGEAVVT